MTELERLSYYIEKIKDHTPSFNQEAKDQLKKEILESLIEDSE